MVERPWPHRLLLASFAALLLVWATTLLTGRDARAEGSVSGEWHIVMTSAPPAPEQLARRVPWFEVDCVLFISQDGAKLSSPVACGSASGAVLFSGTFDKATMHFSLQGDVNHAVMLGMSATLSQDGVSATGSWASSPSFPAMMSGALTATHADGWWGDVDCSGQASSIDVLWILQRVANLPVSLSCLAYGDVNVDGTVSALDAVLILQREAGLIPRLPVL